MRVSKFEICLDRLLYGAQTETGADVSCQGGLTIH